MLLFSVTKQLENRCIEHWKTLLFNDDNKSGGNKLRTYRNLNISDFDKFKFIFSSNDLDICKICIVGVNKLHSLNQSKKQD